MADAVLLLPTRGRPDRIEAAIDGWRSNSTRTDLLVCLDNDDPTLDQYQRHPDVQYRVGPRLRMCPTVNAAASEVADRYKYIGFIGDDHLIRTLGWDELLIQSIGDWGIAYGDDRLQGQGLATHCMLSSNIVGTLGYMAIPGLTHLYMDNFWMDLGHAIPGFLTYRPDVIVEHMHPTAGKSASDDGYAEVNAPEMFSADRRVHEQWRSGGGLERDVDLILSAMHR